MLIVWQLRLWVTINNKYVHKSLRTKVKDYATTEGENFTQIEVILKRSLSTTQLQLKHQ